MEGTVTSQQVSFKTDGQMQWLMAAAQQLCWVRLVSLNRREKLTRANMKQGTMNTSNVMAISG